MRLVPVPNSTKPSGSSNLAIYSARWLLSTTVLSFANRYSLARISLENSVVRRGSRLFLSVEVLTLATEVNFLSLKMSDIVLNLNSESKIYFLLDNKSSNRMELFNASLFRVSAIPNSLSD